MKYTTHARERMHALDISEASVCSVVEAPDRFSLDERRCVTFYGTRAGHTIRVAFNPFEDLVITVGFFGTVGVNL